MTITLPDAGRNAMINALTALVDVGGAGSLQILAAADAVIATLPLNVTAFAAAASGAAAANAITDDTSAVGGSAVAHRIMSGGAVEIWRGDIGTSGADLNMSSLTIGAGDTVSVSSYTITQPAS